MVSLQQPPKAELALMANPNPKLTYTIAEMNIQNLFQRRPTVRLGTTSPFSSLCLDHEAGKGASETARNLVGIQGLVGLTELIFFLWNEFGRVFFLH